MTAKNRILSILVVLALFLPSCGIITIGSDTTAAKTTGLQETEPPETEPPFSYVEADLDGYEAGVERSAAERVVRAVNHAIDVLNEYGGREVFKVSDYDPSKHPRAYDALSENQKKCYDVMAPAVVSFGDYDIDENDPGRPVTWGNIVDVEQAIYADFPLTELYYSDSLENVHHARYFMPNQFSKTSKDVGAVKAAVGVYERIFDLILKLTPEGLNNYQKCMFFAALLCELCTYDTTFGTQTDPFQAYDVLINGTAVCLGYTQAFRQLCHAAGVECRNITGKTLMSKEGETHIWNVVDTDDGVKYIDVTWTDGTTEERGGLMAFDYFMMDAQRLEFEGYEPDYSSEK